ncbi:MAG: esterase family protein [Anaerolineales bacterium]|nr:esterase family protein [Anaerolineales bacterium]
MKHLLLISVVFLLSACAGTEGLASDSGGPAANTAAAIPTAVMAVSATRTATTMPTLAATATPALSLTPTRPACLNVGGEIIVDSLRTDLLNLPLNYRVYLPPCYHADNTTRYPVLYLIHGQTFTDDQWPRLGVAEVADAMIAAGEAPAFIMVFPHDRVWRQPSEDAFGEAVIEELIPLIDENYRTLRGRPFRAVGGLSRGASWAIHFGLSHPELFGTVGAHSLPVFWEDVPHVKAWLDEIPADQMPRFFIDVGTKDYEDIINSATWFKQQLDERDIPNEWYQLEGYHDEAYWSGNLELYLEYYTRLWGER